MFTDIHEERSSREKRQSLRRETRRGQLEAREEAKTGEARGDETRGETQQKEERREATASREAPTRERAACKARARARERDVRKGKQRTVCPLYWARPLSWRIKCAIEWLRRELSHSGEWSGPPFTRALILVHVTTNNTRVHSYLDAHL